MRIEVIFFKFALDRSETINGRWQYCSRNCFLFFLIIPSTTFTDCDRIISWTLGLSGITLSVPVVAHELWNQVYWQNYNLYCTCKPNNTQVKRIGRIYAKKKKNIIMTVSVYWLGTLTVLSRTLVLNRIYPKTRLSSTL